MKRPRDEDRHFSSSLDDKWEGFFGAFLQRHPRLLLRICLTLVVVLVIALAAVKFSE